jgi:hypothetical protein
LTSVASLIKGYNKTLVFEKVLRSIRPPEKKNTVFTKPYVGQRLSLAIIEPRNQEALRYWLYNMAHVSDASLYIFHGTENAEYVQEIMDWSNVQLVNHNVSKLVYPTGANG